MSQFQYSLTDLLTSIIAAPPNFIRPSVIIKDVSSRIDDLTDKLRVFLKLNNLLEKAEVNGEEFIKY